MIENFEILTVDEALSAFFLGFFLSPFIPCFNLIVQGYTSSAKGWGSMKTGSSTGWVLARGGFQMNPLMATSTSAKCESFALITCFETWQWVEMGLKPKMICTAEVGAVSKTNMIFLNQIQKIFFMTQI